MPKVKMPATTSIYAQSRFRLSGGRGAAVAAADSALAGSGPANEHPRRTHRHQKPFRPWPRPPVYVLPVTAAVPDLNKLLVDPRAPAC